MIKKPAAKLIKKFSLTLLMVTSLASVAHADWRSDMGVFRVGVATRYGEPFKTGQFEQFRAEISKALNMPVEIFQARDASALIDATASSRIEYAIVSAVAYATLNEMCDCVSPLVAPIAGDGASSVRSVLIANPQTIPNLDDLSGKRIGIGPQSSLTGFMLPSAQFRAGGKSLSQSGATLVKTKSAEEALTLFLDGQLDGFFGWQSIIPDSDRNPENLMAERLKLAPGANAAVLWQSEAVRYGPHVVRKNLPKEAVTALREMLLKLDADAPLVFDAISPDLAGSFVAVAPGDYKNVDQLIRALADMTVEGGK